MKVHIFSTAGYHAADLLRAVRQAVIGGRQISGHDRGDWWLLRIRTEAYCVYGVRPAKGLSSLDEAQAGRLQVVNCY